MIGSTFILASWPSAWSPTTFARLGLLVGALTLLVLIAAAVVAWRQVKEAQQLRKEQARPFVLIDFHAWSTIVEIVITNIGKTIARDVRFEFDPPLQSTRDGQPNETPRAELNLFKHGIPSLAPGKEMKLFFDQFRARVDAKLPLTYHVQVRYRDHAGEDYSEPMVLDLAAYVGTGGITRYGVHDIYQQVKSIADNVKRWTDFSWGLKVFTRADAKEREAEWEAEDRALAAAETEAANGNGDGTSEPS